jgi:hypothetical protein
MMLFLKSREVLFFGLKMIGPSLLLKRAGRGSDGSRSVIGAALMLRLSLALNPGQRSLPTPAIQLLMVVRYAGSVINSYK